MNSTAVVLIAVVVILIVAWAVWWADAPMRSYLRRERKRKSPRRSTYEDDWP